MLQSLLDLLVGVVLLLVGLLGWLLSWVGTIITVLLVGGALAFMAFWEWALNVSLLDDTPHEQKTTPTESGYGG
jgi:hypothetical protein